MKFRALPITDLTDATLDFEQLQVHGIADDTALGGVLSGKLPKPLFNGLTALKAMGFTTGVFQTGTGTVSVAGTNDWTLSGLATGQATITFPTRASIPAVLATVVTVAGTNAWVEAVNLGTSSVGVVSLNGASAPPTTINAFVSFAVIGF